MNKPKKEKPIHQASTEDLQNKSVKSRLKKKKTTKKEFRLKQRIADHLVHGLLIFTSVFMAFWLSERRETQKNQKIAENALTNVAAEMRYNHQQIVRSFNYQYKILNAMDSTQKANPEITDYVKATTIEGWQGLFLPLLRSSAYASIINSGILKDVPLETANAIARVYNFQNIIERFEDNILSAASQASDFNSIERIRFFYGTFYDIFPEVMAVYQLIGKEYLEPYGYNLELEEGIFKERVEEFIY